MTIHAIFADGVFRPLERVDLPEQAEVEFEPRLVQTKDRAGASRRVYSILAQSFDTEVHDLAARHDEHQP